MNCSATSAEPVLDDQSIMVERVNIEFVLSELSLLLEEILFDVFKCHWMPIFSQFVPTAESNSRPDHVLSCLHSNLSVKLIITHEKSKK